MPAGLGERQAAQSADFTLADLPGKAADDWGDRVAFAGAGPEMTYGTFHDRVRRLAAVLSQAGVAEGTRVGLLSANEAVYFELFFACALLGAVMVPFNVRLAPREIAHQRENAEVGHAVLSPALADLAMSSGLTTVTHWWLGGTYDAAIAVAAPDPRRGAWPPGTPVTQMYTSGTTGFPKGCVHSQEGWRASALNLALGLRLDRRAAVLAQAPLFHAWGLGVVLSHLYMGGTVVFLPGPGDFWEAVDRYQVTTLTVPRTAPADGRPREQVTVVTGLAGGFRRSAGRPWRHSFPTLTTTVSTA